MKTTSTLIVISLVAAPGAAMAQAGQPIAGGGVEAGSPPGWAPGVQEIVVTANKREQSLNSVGLTVTALGSEQLATRKISSLADMAAAVPGLTFSQGPTNAPVLTLRGVGFNDRTLAAIPSVSSYLDEVPLPYSAMSGQTAFDLDRIEVLKGPQGTLFGQSSTGGAINYIAAKPTSTLEAGGDLGYGRFDRFEGNAYVSGPLSDKVKARFAVHAVHGEEWQRSYLRDDKIGKTRAYAGRLLIDMEPTETLRLQLNINGWRDRSDPQVPQVVAITPQVPSNPPLPFTQQPLPPRDPRAAEWSPNDRPRGNKRLWSTALRADLHLNDEVTLTSLTAYTDYKQRVVPGGDGFTLNVNDIPLDSGYLRSFSQEVRLANAGDGQVRWVVGATYDRSKTYEDVYVDFPDGSSAVFGFASSGVRGSQNRKGYGGFGNIEFDVTPAITVKGGARYSHTTNKAVLCGYDSQNGEVNAFFTQLGRLLSGDPTRPALGPNDCFAILASNGNYGGPPFRGTLREDSLSWRAGVDYKPASDALLYANISKGYKAGSFPVGAVGFEAQFQPVKQESVVAYEAGFKVGLLNRSVQINGAAYYYDYHNKQILAKIADPLFGAIDALVNVPRSSVKGAELEVVAAPAEGLSLSAQILYTDAKVTRYVGISAAGQAADFAGSRIPYIPKWQIAGTFDYTLPSSGHWRPFVGATVSYRTSSTAAIGAELANSLVIRGEARPFQLDGYALVDLRAGIEAADERYRLFVWGKNIFNAFYAQNQYITYDSVARLTGRPAAWGMTASFKLD